MEPSLSARPQRELEPEFSVIVPARNEEAGLGACLESLVAQANVQREIIVVDDGSTDRTAEIARTFADVKVIEAPSPPEGWSGKSNALWTAAQQARGDWLLFTDADTVHLPGSLARALAEARQHEAALLSYSPAQELHGFIERAVMPVVFAELASVYRPREVCDPNSLAAAANGQYLLISRRAYDAVGGHQAIATCLLEDVELARAVKRSGRRIRFRFGGDAVRTRMYRSASQLCEGWTKNLALLFKAPVRLAFMRLLEFLVVVCGLAVAAPAARGGHIIAAALFTVAVLLSYSRFFLRIRKAHPDTVSTAAALFGLPIFSYLLLRSQLYYKWHRSVTWKGRQYSTAVSNRETRRGAKACPAGEPWST